MYEEVKALWIISDTGLNLLSSQGDSNILVDSDLFSGLLSAIHSFSKSVGLTALRQTETQDLRLVYGYRSHLLFVLAGDKHIDTEILEKHLLDFQNKFFSKFEGLVWENFLKGVIKKSKFNDFQKEINNLIIERKDSKINTDSLKKAFSRVIRQND